MENNIKTFSLFIKPDEKSNKTADKLRYTIEKFNSGLKENENGDLIIAIGGDGTFIDAVTSTNFDKNKVYVGIHTGTLGFLQNICKDELFTLIQYLSHEPELNTRKIHVSSAKIYLKDSTTKEFFSLNEVLVAGKNYSNISFAEYISDELFQNVTGNGIIMATNTGDTAYSLNAGGSIDLSNHVQLVCTPLTGNMNAAYERFISNPVICSKITLLLKPSNHIQIIIDGKAKDIDSNMIERVEVSMLTPTNFINKLEIGTYSKATVIRNKLLGYSD